MTEPRQTLLQALAPDLVEALEQLVSERVQAELEEERARARWLTLDEAAVRYRTTAAALRKRAQRGTLPGAVRDGGRWLVDATVLDQALASGQGAIDNGKGPRR